MNVVELIKRVIKVPILQLSHTCQIHISSEVHSIIPFSLINNRQLTDLKRLHNGLELFLLTINVILIILRLVLHVYGYTLLEKITHTIFFYSL